LSMVFEDSGNMVTLRYKIDNREYEVNLYETGDALVAVSESVLSLNSTRRIENGCSTVDISIIIHVGNLYNSSVYSDVGSKAGKLNFCIEMVLLANEDLFGGDINSSMSTTEVTFNRLNFVADISYGTKFEIAQIMLDLENMEAIGTGEELASNLITCQCSPHGICYNETMDSEAMIITQSKKLYICLQVMMESLKIASVSTLVLHQAIGEVDHLSLSCISSPKQWNTLTTVTGEDSQNVVISTHLVSAFFRQPHNDVTAIGSLVLDFGTDEAEVRRRLDFEFPWRNVVEVEGPTFSIDKIQLLDVNTIEITNSTDESSSTVFGNILFVIPKQIIFYCFVVISFDFFLID